MSDDTHRSVDYVETIPVSADKVWHWLGDFGSIISWLPPGATGTIEVVGEGVGALRNLDLNVVGKVQHELTAYDAEARSITYLLTKGQPLGMVKYWVQVTAETADENACRLVFHGEFDGDPSFDLDEMATNLEGSYQGMAAGLLRVASDG